MIVGAVGFPKSPTDLTKEPISEFPARFAKRPLLLFTVSKRPSEPGTTSAGNLKTVLRKIPPKVLADKRYDRTGAFMKRHLP
jgi:hypothetical protein